MYDSNSYSRIRQIALWIYSGSSDMEEKSFDSDEDCFLLGRVELGEHQSQI